MSETAQELAGADPKMGEVFANPAAGATRRQAHDSTTLYYPNTPAKALYYIEAGQVRLYQIGPDNSARLVDILGPGEWFGIAALAMAPTYGGQAVVVSESVLWELPAERLMGLVTEQPQIAQELVVQLAMQLQSAHDAAAGLVFNDCNQRLIQTLVRFSRTAAATPQEGGGVVLHITHQQLAQAVGAARETISLALTQLRQRNLLRTGRNRLHFDPETLKQFERRVEYSQASNAGHPRPL